MSLFNAITTPPIGLDVGKRLIKAVQLGSRRGRTVVAASAMLGRSRPDAPMDLDEVIRVRRVLSQQGFKGKRVVLSAPSDRMMSSVIDMPPRGSGVPYETIALQEFARIQRQAPGSFEIAWWDVPAPARATSGKVMAVGCAHTESEPLLTLFEEAGFDVAAVDSGLCAAVRASLSNLGSPVGVSALLDLGWASARLAMVHQNVVIFDRLLAGSGQAKLHERAGLALNIDPVEADVLLQSVGLLDRHEQQQQTDGRLSAVAPVLAGLLESYLGDIAGELSASFEYAQHQYPDAEPQCLVLTGGGAAIPGVLAGLDGMVTTKVTEARIPAIITNASGVDTLSAALLCSACGLAGMGEGGGS